MRKQLLFLFVCFVTLPVIIIYSVATVIFNRKADENLTNIYSNDIRSIASIAENYFSESLDLTMYPLLNIINTPKLLPALFFLIMSVLLPHIPIRIRFTAILSSMRSVFPMAGNWTSETLNMPK